LGQKEAAKKGGKGGKKNFLEKGKPSEMKGQGKKRTS